MKLLALALVLFVTPAVAQQISPPPSVPVTGGAFTGNVAFSISFGLTAAGTGSGNALALTSQVNQVSTVASGTGVRLPSLSAGVTITVINRGANTLNVYPNAGGTIDGAAANIAVTLAAGASSRYTCTNNFAWFSN